MKKSHWAEHLRCFSLSAHQKDRAELREQASINPLLRDRVLSEWLKSSGIDGLDSSMFYVGTCHRVELYAYGVDEAKIAKEWKALSGSAVDRLRVIRGEAVLEHWIRVCVSLESEVLGETQITGQMKNAMDHARDYGTLKGPLDRFSQRVLAASKRIRSELPIGEGTVSVAHVAVDGVQDFFDDLASKSALVVGAGSMALQAIERLRSLGVKRLTWANRSYEKIRSHELARHCRTVEFSTLHEEIWQHSISVFATASHARVVDHEALLEKRPNDQNSNGPRVLLDLGLPRNVDAQIHGQNGFYVRDVDEFSNQAERNSKIRKQYVALAGQRCVGEAQKMVEEARKWKRSPKIQEFIRLVEERKTADQLRLRLEKSSDIDYITASIYSSLLHGILKEAEDLDDEAAADFLENLMRAWSRSGRWQKVLQKPEKRKPDNVKSP